MQILKQMRTTNGIKIVIGSAFFWSWLDAMFMSAFFVPESSRGLMSEVAVVLIFGLSACGFLFALRKPALINRLLGARRLPLTAAALGTAGSLLFFFAGTNQSWITLFIGGAFGSVFMAVFQLGWGAAYCHEGSHSATPYVAGGFACAVIIDTPLLFMIPEASAVFFSLLPLVTGGIFASLDPHYRTYRRGNEPATPPTRNRSIGGYLKTHLGTSMTLLCAVMLVMVGFGYVQHLVSFSSVAGGSESYGVAIQVARGVAALLMFAFIMLVPRRTSIVYRGGLLAMIAGFMMMPFMFGTNLFWISGAVIIIGYTAFDLLIWVAFSQIAFAQSRAPLKTIAVMRLLSVVCTVMGSVVGIALVGNSQHLHEFVSAETTVVGYLVVIATVLMLSSEDMWMLFGMNQPASTGDPDMLREERLIDWFNSIGLTVREREIAVLLAAGRTQPWIAERLSISENTVGTHVRHIYQKADVHDRQQFIDAVSKPEIVSPESREHSESLTEDT